MVLALVPTVAWAARKAAMVPGSAGSATSDREAHQAVKIAQSRP
jgi:hypothetical protein